MEYMILEDDAPVGQAPKNMDIHWILPDEDLAKNELRKMQKIWQDRKHARIIQDSEVSKIAEIQMNGSTVKQRYAMVPFLGDGIYLLCDKNQNNKRTLEVIEKYNEYEPARENLIENAWRMLNKRTRKRTKEMFMDLLITGINPAPDTRITAGNSGQWIERLDFIQLKEGNTETTFLLLAVF